MSACIDATHDKLTKDQIASFIAGDLGPSPWQLVALNIMRQQRDAINERCVPESVLNKLERDGYELRLFFRDGTWHGELIGAGSRFWCNTLEGLMRDMGDRCESRE